MNWDIDEEDIAEKTEQDIEDESNNSSYGEQYSEEYSDQIVAEMRSENRETRVISSARSKLEQARLYEMLINHKIFNGVEADTEIVNVVESEIKEFILGRLEILLGMKEDVSKQTSSPTEYASPFSDDEVQILKILASKISGTAPSSVVQQIRQESAPAKPKQGLNSINLTPKKEIRPTTPTAKQTQKPASTKPPQRQQTATSPTNKKSQVTLTEQERRLVGGKEHLTEQDLITAKKDIQYLSRLKKPVHKMSKEELIEASQFRPSRPKPPPLDNESVARSTEINAAMSGANTNGGLDGQAIAGLLRKAGKLSTSTIEEV